MKKKDTKLLILLAILLVFVIAFRLVGYFTDKQEETDTITVFDIKQENITQLDWTKNSEEFSLKCENGEWKYANDEMFPLDTDGAVSMAKTVAEVKATREFEADNISDYGLDNSLQTITVTTSDASQYKIILGDKNDVTDECYMMLEGGSKVYMISTSLSAVFDKTIDDLIKMEEIKKPENYNSIVMKSFGKELKLTKNEDGTWTDGTQLLDTQKVIEFADKFLNLVWQTCPYYNADDVIKSDCGFNTPTAEVTISGDDGEVKIIFGTQNPGNVFAKLADSNMIYTVSSEINVTLEATSDILLPDKEATEQ